MNHSAPVYSNIENLLLWASLEEIGCAANICCGIMEHWNVGILGLAERDLYHIDGTDQKVNQTIIRF